MLLILIYFEFDYLTLNELNLIILSDFAHEFVFVNLFLYY